MKRIAIWTVVIFASVTGIGLLARSAQEAGYMDTSGEIGEAARQIERRNENYKRCQAGEHAYCNLLH